jgi:outer membrane protein assembly factor BamD (BamD/ComL family)
MSAANVPEPPSQAVTEGLSTLKAEAAAIERARRALASASPGQAIELLDRYERESPTHALAPDARALRIQAEKARGNDVLAKELAEKFLSLYPSDPHAERVRRVLLGP